MRKYFIPFITFILEASCVFGCYMLLNYTDMEFVVKQVLSFSFCLLIAGHYHQAMGLFASEALTLFKGHLIYFVFTLFIIDWHDANAAILQAEINLGFTVMFYGATLLISLLARIIFKRIITERIVIIGVGENAKKVFEALSVHRYSNKKAVAFINLNNNPNFLRFNEKNLIKRDSEISKKCRIYSFERIDDFIKYENVDAAIFTIQGLNYAETKVVESALRSKISKVLYVPEYKNLFNLASKIDEYDGLLMVESSIKSMQLKDYFVKRLFDFIFSLLGSIFLIPLSIFVRLGMWFTGDFGPLFFVHKRVCKGGKEFRMLKFRTMNENAEQELSEMLRVNSDMKKQYEIYKKIENDHRVTKFGRFLRKSKIDEFPQFLNILIGKMSFIGPRPVPKHEVEGNEDYYDLMIKMKPGATGIWQAVSYKDTTYESRLQLDEFYYNNYSVWLDFKILFSTLINILRGRVTS